MDKYVYICMYVYILFPTRDWKNDLLFRKILILNNLYGSKCSSKCSGIMPIWKYTYANHIPMLLFKIWRIFSQCLSQCTYQMYFNLTHLLIALSWVSSFQRSTEYSEIECSFLWSIKIFLNIPFDLWNDIWTFLITKINGV